MSMNNTPDSPVKSPDDRMDQGGNYWTLFTPGIWKSLHAVLEALIVAECCPCTRRHWVSGTSTGLDAPSCQGCSDPAVNSALLSRTAIKSQRYRRLRRSAEGTTRPVA